MNLTIENRFVLLLKKAFTGLAVNVDDETCLQLAKLIHQAMDHDFRVYHTSAHIFDLCKGMNARQTLAALFHDIIYYQLDVLSNVDIHRLVLKNIGSISNNILTLNAIQDDDLAVKLCINIFGFRKDQTIPLHNGVNEFLSAVLLTQALQPYLNLNDLLAINAAIEATIPFRGADNQGRQSLELLAERLKNTAELLGIAQTENDIDAAITDAVILANQDVASFASADQNYFLSTTWLLIEEANTAFKAPHDYTIQDYRNALLSMENFFLKLNPENVFHYYKNTPDQHEFTRLKLVSEQNISFALDYIGTKIAGIGVIEALALLTGGDCPISTMLGDISENKKHNDRFKQLLEPLSVAAPVNSDLLKVLVTGRKQPSKYDLSESPITAYLCKRLGQTQVLNLAQQAKLMFKGLLTPEHFLNTLDADLVRNVAKTCATMTDSRSAELLALEFL